MIFPHPLTLEDGTFIGISVVEMDLIYMEGEDPPIKVINCAVEQTFLLADHESPSQAAMVWIKQNDPGG